MMMATIAVVRNDAGAFQLPLLMLAYSRILKEFTGC